MFAPEMPVCQLAILGLAPHDSGHHVAMKPDTSQIEFQFGQSLSTKDGLDQWHQERERTLQDLAGKMGLPLGHKVEVMLRGGALLQGNLRLADDQLWIETQRNFRLLLRIDRCTFAAAEIESCVRLD